eukprot:3012688-Pyramimonas_sp.AAC.1
MERHAASPGLAARDAARLRDDEAVDQDGGVQQWGPAGQRCLPRNHILNSHDVVAGQAKIVDTPVERREP